MKLLTTVLFVTVTPIVLAAGSTLDQGQVQRGGASVAHAAALHPTKQNRAATTMEFTAASIKSLRSGATPGLEFTTRTDGIRVMSRDGHALRAASVRAGDRVTIGANGLVRDLSQQWENLQGVISAAPASASEPLMLLVQHSTDIVVDTDKQTRYSDRSEETQLITGIEEADQVIVRGMLDTRLGEMTQTDSVSRIGPFPQRVKARRSSIG